LSMKIFITAGEDSGDLHASLLVREIKKILPEAEFEGMGGKRMEKEGVKLVENIKGLSVVGFQEVLSKWRKLLQVYNKLAEKLRKGNYSLFIPVDYPGMNLRLCKVAKEKGIKVIYYISPQLWAWGERRVEWIRKFVDKMIVILPFEEDFYRKRGIEAIFVGHPLVERVVPEISEEEFRKKYLKTSLPLIGLLPGSREEEVKRHLPLFKKLITHFQGKFEFLVLRARNVEEDIYHGFRTVFEEPYSLMKYSYLLVVASGTATLEAGLLCTPMVIIYRSPLITYLVGRSLLKIPHVGLVNIVMGKRIVPELVGCRIKLEDLAREIQKIAKEEENKRIRRELSNLKRILGESGAVKRAAKVICENL